jgi:hypothetical protein
MNLKQMIRGLRGMSRKPPKTVLPAGDLGSHWDTFLERNLSAPLGKELVDADVHVREGRFQRTLSLMAGTSSVLAGLEVSYEHYKGSYGQKIMWTPVVLSGAMTGAGIWGFISTWAAKTVLRWTSIVTLLDSLIGFFAHFRTAPFRRERLYGTYCLVSSARGVARNYRYHTRCATRVSSLLFWAPYAMDPGNPRRTIPEASRGRDHPERLF